MVQIKMNKKGFVFTLIALMLFSSLFVITAIYLKRNIQAQDFISKSGNANRLKFIRENIVNDFYTIMDIDLKSIERLNNKVFIKFENFSNISSNSPYVDNLTNYEHYIENNYSSDINNQINLTDFVPQFKIYPYNSTFLIDRNRFYLYTNDFKKVINLTINIFLNVSNIKNIQKPTNRSSNNIPVHFQIFNKTKKVFVNETLYLNMSEEGNNYFIEFNDTTPYPNITIEFGRHRQIRYFGSDILTNGTLFIESNNINAKIEKFWITMEDVDKKVVMKTKSFLFIE